MKNIFLLFVSVVFSSVVNARADFHWAGFFKLHPQDQERYLMVLEEFLIEAERAQRSGARGGDPDLEGFRGYWNIQPGPRESLLFRLLIERVFAEETREEGARKAWCFNNGVIAEVADCSKANRWGFATEEHLKPLDEAGLKSSCPKGPTAAQQGGVTCGLLGLKADLTLACAKNSTRDCSRQGDRKTILGLMNACVERGADGQVAMQTAEGKPPEPKLKPEVEFQGKKGIKCQGIYNFMKSQLTAMAEQCGPSQEIAAEAKKRGVTVSEAPVKIDRNLLKVCHHTLNQVAQIMMEFDEKGRPARVPASANN